MYFFSEYSPLHTVQYSQDEISKDVSCKLFSLWIFTQIISKIITVNTTMPPAIIEMICQPLLKQKGEEGVRWAISMCKPRLIVNTYIKKDGDDDGRGTICTWWRVQGSNTM